MRFIPRLLPVLIGAAALLLCAKVADVWLSIGIDPLASAQAQTAPEPAKAEPAKPGHTAEPAPAAAGKRPPRDPMLFSPQEVEILQSLAQRRDELDKRTA